MKLSSLVPAEAIVPQLEATRREDVLKELVGVLVSSGKLKKETAGAVVKALLSREELGSTGIGKGVAVPHAKHEAVQGLVAAFGRSKKGVDFSALDGQPVHLFFMLLSCKDSGSQHLEGLARVARLVRDDRFCRFLRDAKDRKEIADLLAEADAHLDSPGGSR